MFALDLQVDSDDNKDKSLILLLKDLEAWRKDAESLVDNIVQYCEKVVSIFNQVTLAKETIAQTCNSNMQTVSTLQTDLMNLKFESDRIKKWKNVNPEAH